MKSFIFFALCILTLAPSARAADGQTYDLAIAGEGPVGLFAAVKLKLLDPSAKVAIFEARPQDREGRPNTPTYGPEAFFELQEVGLTNDNFTQLRARIYVQPGEKPRRVDTDLSIVGHYEAYHPEVLLENRPTAPARAQAVGITESDLRALARHLGVEFHDDSQVTAAKNILDGVELMVRGESVHAKFGILADGAHGLGSKLANTRAIGSIPMMAAVSNTVGDGVIEIRTVLDPSAPEGHVGVIRIGAKAGISVLAEIPPSMEDASDEAKINWFREQARRVDVDPRTFKRDVHGNVIPPKAFPAALSHGASGDGRLFFAGDASGTVPIITGSGVNKGILQARDDVEVIDQLLRDPDEREHAPAVLAAHHRREDLAQEQLVAGFARSLSVRLRPVPDQSAVPAQSVVPGQSVIDSAAGKRAPECGQLGRTRFSENRRRARKSGARIDASGKSNRGNRQGSSCSCGGRSARHAAIHDHDHLRPSRSAILVRQIVGEGRAPAGRHVLGSWRWARAK